jgi:hypothetical protein
METLQTKRGRIETIGEDRITIRNLDGFCQDTLHITPGKAIYIENKFGFEKEVFYSVKGSELIHMWVDEAFPELRSLYDAIPKERECTSFA